jgi:Cu2+-exporting ATPase
MPESLTIAVSLNGVWQLGWGLNDPVRAVAPQVVAALRQEGVAAWILSGDSPERTQRTAAFLQVAVLAAAALPEQKLEAIRRLQDATPRVAMVGDGINDVPVLAAASVSLAMGHGSSEALAQADFLVLDGRLDGVITGLRTARAAVRVIRQNFAWAMGYNAVAVPLAVLGQLPPWLAGLGMACSSLIVLVNSQRLRTRFA